MPIAKPLNVDSLKRIIVSIDSLAGYSEFLLSLTKPTVDIKLSSEIAQDAGSRLGGHPYLPADFQWPNHDDGEYRFLGQINFLEIADRPSSLPDFGLLTFFYAFDDGECFWGDDGYVLGFYWPNYKGHIIFDSPVKDVPGTQKIQLTGSIDIPRYEVLRQDWPFDPDALYELTAALDPNEAYLLGYPSFNTLEYDPTPDSSWVSLLTVSSLDEFDWCWNDGDKLMVFIESEKLAQRDFSHLKTDAG